MIITPLPQFSGHLFLQEKLTKLKFFKNLTKSDWSLPSSHLLSNRREMIGAKITTVSENQNQSLEGCVSPKEGDGVIG